jgi:hypothetical protein
MRAKLYAKFEAANPPSASMTSTEALSQTPGELQATPPTASPAPVASAPSPTATVEEPASPPEPESAPSPVQKKEKFVPYDAMHEERERRKEAVARAKKLEEQNQELLNDLKRFVRPVSPPVEEEYVDPIVKKLQEELAALKRTQEEQSQFVQSQKQRSFEEEMRKKVERAKALLAQEGIPVSPYFEQMVSYELNQELLQNPDDQEHINEVMRKDRDPEEWVKIYKEKVWPKHAPVVERTKAAAANPQKDELKRQAALLGSPGQAAPAPEPKSETYTYQDYINDRKKHLVQ